MSMWEDVKRNLMEWYAVTTDKTAEVAKVTSLRYDKFGISRDIERQFSELGNLVYTALKEDRMPDRDDPALAAIIERLDSLENELRAKEEEIAAVRRRHAERVAKAKSATLDPDVAGGTAEAGSAAPEEEAGQAAAPEEPLEGPVMTENGAETEPKQEWGHP